MRLLSAMTLLVFSFAASASEKAKVEVPMTVIYKDQNLQLEMGQQGACTPAHSRVILRIKNVGTFSYLTVFFANGAPDFDVALTGRHGVRCPYTPTGHARFVDRDAFSSFDYTIAQSQPKDWQIDLEEYYKFKPGMHSVKVNGGYTRGIAGLPGAEPFRFEAKEFTLSIASEKKRPHRVAQR